MAFSARWTVFCSAELGQYRVSDMVVPELACPDMAMNTVIDVARTKRFVIIASLRCCGMLARDDRSQSKWCALPAGSIKNGFSFVTASSSLSILIPSIGQVIVASLTDRRSHGPENAHNQKNNQSQQLLAERMVAKSGVPNV